MSPGEVGPLSDHVGGVVAARPAVDHQQPDVALVADEVATFAVDWQVDPGSAWIGSGKKEVADPAPVPATADRWLAGEGAADGPGFSFAVGRALGTVVVTARGTLDAAGSRVLKAVLGDLIDNQGNLAVVVDLHHVTDVDPECLGIFVTAHGWAVMRGGHLCLAGVGPRVASALEEAGVARLVKMAAARILALPAPMVPSVPAATPPTGQNGFGR